MAKPTVVLIGYSGHSYVAYDCLVSADNKVVGYCEEKEKTANPYKLKYFGSERDRKVLALLKQHGYFIAVGKNDLRQRIYLFLKERLKEDPVKAIHSSAIISASARILDGVLVSPNVVINAGSIISAGTICNTSSIIEHECVIGSFCHIAPGATLCGNVKIGNNSFVGANSVVKEGIVIGDNAIIGAGTVVVKNVPDNAIVAGNPQRQIKKSQAP